MMLNKCLSNKKGIVGRALIFFYSILPITIIFLVFFIFVFKFSIFNKNKIIQVSDELADFSFSSSVLGFLHFKVDDHLSVVDLLVLEKYSEFYDQLKKHFGADVKCSIQIDSAQVISDRCNPDVFMELPKDKQLSVAFSIPSLKGEVKNVVLQIDKK